MKGQDFPRELLKSLYYAIKHEPIPWALNNTVGGGEIPKEIIASVGGGGGDNGLDSFSHEDQQSRERGRSWEELYPKKDSKENSSQENLQRAATEDDNLSSNLLPKPINLGSGINPFLALPDPMSSTDYKKGYVMRKCCVDPNGKRTKLGKRSWKMFYLSLRDMVLYCFKDEKSLRAPGAFEDLNQAIRIHHGLAVRASDYTKKQFVFRLHTCDQAEYLFQTSDEKELLTWIDAINYVVASFSSPKLPAPVSSSHARFQRPLLPSSKSKLSPGEQLQENESALSELRRELEEHLQNRPPKNSSSASISFFKDKQDYLSFEVQRYETYILTLRTKYTSEQCTDDGDKSKSLERIF
ncbi:PSD [Lepeophtheirus salmonis]|uniref:PSD n=1 Tax=Lepeophtheirus salmonis TaxID=72036 RepID=A0A7R8CH59_LEPSM|nr:PSD [Lepeophtheirus salmonis]CAF2777068.1 PSD [Lepeophtheirus salmonis]